MGLTAESVQVYTAGRSAANPQGRIAEAATAHLLHQGYEQTAREENADRTIVIAPTSNGGWVTVYDSEFGSSEVLAKELSKAVLSPAVSLAVFDSDDIFIRLFEAGKLKDRHEVSGGRLRKRGKASNWSSVAERDQQNRINGILAGQPLFAEEQLTNLAEALGMNADQCVTPASHLEELSTDLEADGFLRLYFRRRGASQAPATHLGPPVLAPGPVSQHWSGAPGEHLPAAGIYAVNQGGAMRGVRVSLRGSALSEDLISLRGIRIFNPGRKDIHDFDLSAGAREVELADFTLAKAPSQRGFLPGRVTMDHAISVSLDGVLKQPGQGEMHVVITPLENPAGEAVLVYPVIVHRPVQGPLKADLTLPGASQRCRALHLPRTFQGILSFRPDKAAAAAFAASAIAQWVEFLERSRPDGWFCTRVAAPLKMPQFLETQRNDLTRQKQWTKWMRGIAENESLTGHIGLPRREGDLNFSGCGGFGFHLGEAHTWMSALDASPHLSVWLDTKVLTDDEIEQGEQMFAQWANEAISNGLALQAVQVRWLTGDGSSVEFTPYEFASGVQGQCTMTSWWCRRYLRAVGEYVWLAPELLDRLPAPPPNATPLGQGVRLHQPEEAALEPILAGRTEWEQGMRVRYNRA